MQRKYIGLNFKETSTNFCKSLFENHTIKLTININPKPTTERIDSNKVHVKKVSFIDSP